jgi:hypothetical protein
MLRFLFFALIIIWVYLLLKKFFSQSSTEKTKKHINFKQSNKMVECPVCKVYVVPTSPCSEGRCPYR